MKIYKISQGLNTGWDTYDSVVVCAESEDDARTIHPSEYITHITNNKWMGTYSGGIGKGNEYEQDSSNWVLYSEIDKIIVEYIGEASTEQKRGVILASFNAG